MKNLFYKYSHAMPLIIYGVIYITWFYLLEHRDGGYYEIIHMSIDDKIPFCEWFVIPYFMWFGYIALTVLFMFFKNRDDYYRICAFLFSGMTIFLIISTFFPNAQQLRPSVMPRDNILTYMVSILYKLDTATNLWPSIHVYNSLGAHFAIMQNNELLKHKKLRFASLILCISIILSTMFIKQHSFYDVITAFILAAFMYIAIYRSDLILSLRLQYRKFFKKKHQANL